MHVPRRSTALLLVLVACGGGGTGPGGDGSIGEHDDASVTGDGAVQSTSVSGTLDGSPFTLTHASVAWPSADSRTWLCVSSEAVAYEDCLEPAGPSRIVVHGPFVVAEDGSGAWVTPQVGLYEVGPSPSSDIADASELDLIEYSPAEGKLTLVLELDFADNGVVSGGVRLP